MHGARLGHVGLRAAELLHGDVLAGDGLDDVGSGDEHLAGLVDHDDEVGQRGGVDVPAGRGAHDQRDLRDDAGGQDVVAEDPAVEAQRDHTLLDAGAGAVVDADQRAAGLDGQLLDLDDLLAVHLAEAAAEHGGVLAEDADVAAVDGAVAGDHPVAGGPVLVQAEVGGLRCLASASSSTNESSSSSARMRSRAVSLPLACTFSTAVSPTGCSASSARLRRSASFPAVVWMSISWDSAGAEGSVTLVMGVDAIGARVGRRARPLIVP